ncbi:hypothetical protein [Amycolatopsis sp. NPDC054798]
MTAANTAPRLPPGPKPFRAAENSPGAPVAAQAFPSAALPVPAAAPGSSFARAPAARSPVFGPHRAPRSFRLDRAAPSGTGPVRVPRRRSGALPGPVRAPGRES